MPDSKLKNENGKKYIRGEIVFTIYENSENHFTIFKVKIHETNERYEDEEIVCKGNVMRLQKGVVYEFYGQLVNHPKFGTQYNVEAYQTFIPETADAVITYLSSDLFPGVGKKTAQKVVDGLGEQAITKILNNEKVIDTIAGINEKVKKTIIATLRENQGFEQVAVQLTKYGIGLKMAQQM